mmetsp:Transcript_10726/g.17169  ORF Transcript_10726/g.17169 Transcript_10726/m.17169 type:complete len:202 (-) Transcript_10726:746-1351(-)
MAMVAILVIACNSWMVASSFHASSHQRQYSPRSRPQAGGVAYADTKVPLFSRRANRMLLHSQDRNSENRRRLPKCSATFNKKKFENDGPFKFMKPVLDNYMKPGKGKKVVFGVLQRDVDPATIPRSEEDRAKLRDQAARDLTNIDLEERQRRRRVGQGLNILSAVLGVTLVFLHVPALSRLAIFFPLAFAEGYITSANTGL